MYDSLIFLRTRFTPFRHQGRTRNIQHAALAAVCKAFYFRRGKLASKFPEIFKDGVPDKAVVFVAVGVSIPPACVRYD